MNSEKYTLSSLINKMKEVEKTFTSSLYILLESTKDDKSIESMISNLIVDAEKKMKNIEWIKSFIVEMTLEPITGLNVNMYVNRMKEIVNNRSLTEGKKFEYLIKNQVELYNVVADRIEHISIEAAELFRQYGKKLSSLL